MAPGVIKQINPAVEEKSHQTGFKTRGGMTQGLMFRWTLRCPEQVILQMLEVAILLFSLKAGKKKVGKKLGKTVFPATAVLA